MKDSVIYDILLCTPDLTLAERLSDSRGCTYLFRVLDDPGQIAASLKNFAVDLMLFHADRESDLEPLCELAARGPGLPPAIILASPFLIRKESLSGRLTGLGLTSFIPWPMEPAELIERVDNHFVRHPKTASSLQHRRLYRAGEPIFLENEIGHECFSIVSGRVRICRVIDSRTLTEVNQLGPGDLFGEMALLRDARRSGTALAADDVIVSVTTRELFDRVVERDRGFVENLMRVMRSRILAMESNRPELSAPVAAGSRAVRRGKAAGKERREFKEGETIFTPEEQAKWFYLVESGRVQVGSEGPLNGSGKVGLAGPGDIVGEVAHLLDRPYGVSAVAIEKTTCFCLTEKNLDAGLTANPSLPLKMAQGLAAKLGELLEGLSSQQMHEVF